MAAWINFQIHGTVISSDAVSWIIQVKYTFLKLQEENKLIETSSYMVFNTGLFTEYYESIYAYAVKNLAGGEQPWFLKGFCTEYELANNNIIELPDRANEEKSYCKL